MSSNLFNKKTLKYWIGGGLIAAIVIFLILSATAASAQYFLTVDELLAGKDQYMGRQVRISGAVIGDSVHFDASSMLLTFSIAQVSGKEAEIEAQGGLASAIHQAVNDPSRNRISITYHGTRPDLLKNEAQAILTGTLQPDGSFVADEILLKCPSRYAEDIPVQIEGTP
jgi:cytochrome c-type biogenesis protein CcmE